MVVVPPPPPVVVEVVDEVEVDVDLEGVTVTVTVEVCCDLLFVDLVDLVVVLVLFVFVEVVETLPGGWTVTVLEVEVSRQRPGTLLRPQRPVSGGDIPVVVVPVSPLSVVVPVSVPVSVPVPVPVAVPLDAVVVGSWQAWVPMMWQSERPIPVVVEVSEGMAAANAASGAGRGPVPPERRMLSGTAATTTRGVQSRARTRMCAERSLRCTALPSQGDQVPRPARVPGSVHMFASRHPRLSAAPDAVSRWPDARGCDAGA